MIKRILVGLGGTEYSLVAVKRAVELAKIHDACLTAVTVIDINSLMNVGPVPISGMNAARKATDRRIKQAMEGMDKAIHAFEKSCNKAGVSYNVEREVGDTFDTLIPLSRYFDINILGLRGILDSKYVPEPENAIIKLFSGGVRPIITVSNKYRQIKRALIAFDGSMDSAKAMRRFIQLRLWPNVAVKIICFETGKKEAEKILDDAATYCRAHGYEVDTGSERKKCKKQLLQSADDCDADIIVLGDSIRSLLMRKIFGSVVLHAIRNADRPLFLAH